MSGAAGWRLAMAAKEPDQAGRLRQFQDEHPDADLRPAQFDTCEAWLPGENGGRLIVGHTLRELMDKLDALEEELDAEPP